MRDKAVLSLVCPCGKALELPVDTKEYVCECGRQLVIDALVNSDMRTQDGSPHDKYIAAPYGHLWRDT